VGELKDPTWGDAPTVKTPFGYKRRGSCKQRAVQVGESDGTFWEESWDRGRTRGIKKWGEDFG